MNISDILILGVALAIDAMLVSFSYGITVCVNRIKTSILLSVSFGFFQFLMPIIGWWISAYIYEYVGMYSKWIVFFIFMVLSLKFLKESVSRQDNEIKDCINLFCVFLLSLATSMDALGSGISLRLLKVDIITASIIIGIITFILSEAGFYCGNILCRISKKKIGIIGALLLMYLAIKTLFLK